MAFDGVNTKFKITHDNGTHASVTRASQLMISINGVLQQPHDSASPSSGIGIASDSVLVFSVAPAITDVVFGSILSSNISSFEISDNKIDNFTGDNSTTNFTMSKSPPDPRNILVTLDGVVQYPSDSTTTRAYTVATGTNVVSFTSAPATGVAIQVRHIGFAGGTGSGSGGVTSVFGRTGDVVLSALRINGTPLDSADSTKVTIDEAVDVTGALAVAGQTTLTGSFLPAIHTFTATDAITEIEHAGRTLLLGEVGANALVTLTLPDATGSGATYKFIVSVANTSNYVIKVPDADNTIAGIMTYLDEDGTAVTAFPTVAASDTITLNGGTKGGIVGDYLEIIDIAADKYHVRGVMRVAAGANPATPFSATVS